MEKSVKVITAYTAMYPDPIVVRAGDVFKVGSPDPEQPDWFWCEGPDGRVGWVPKDCIEEGAAKYDYSALELSVSEGEQLLFLREAFGWAFCRRNDGAQGWLPLKSLGAESV